MSQHFPRAVLFLPGTLVASEEGYRFVSPGLPGEVPAVLARQFRAYAPKVLGWERVFHGYPRTDREARLVRLQLVRAHPEPPEGFAPGEGEVAGTVVLAREDLLVIEVATRPPRKPFRLTLRRADPGRPRYRRGGGLAVRVALKDGHLVAAGAEPVALRRPGSESAEDLLAQPARTARTKPSADRPPDPLPSPYTLEDVAPPEERDELPDLPQLPKGQYMGLAGGGPYYVIVKPQLAARWERIEAALDRFPAPHRVLRYPDGTRAIECADREALRVFYKSTFTL